MAREPLKVLVVDDHRLVREGLVSLLRLNPEIEVVGEASGGDEAVAKARSLKPDVVLMDISMPGMNGITATRLIKKDLPETKVIMLTMLDQEGYVYEAVKAGATGYLLKNTGMEELVKAIKEVHKGGATLHPEAQAQLLKEYVYLAQSNRETYGLSERELEILQLLGDGLSNKEISDRLFISIQTVKTHITHIFEKLGVKDRTEAVATALRRGLIS
ncbi:response regulator transcription factor [Candidatus Solincola tengchongensis]|uniref:response regulator transcription factor n=1 Tax=Candidatus Solincola tengchongensis TaxID=2900693 RepID=UPI0025807AFC|nr:response regulator transcription factor [Candidatus Solincola tengchongensis]